MTQILSSEFLAGNGFRLGQYPDGKYWVRNFTCEYFMQVNEPLDHFVECGGDFAEELTQQEFLDTLARHNKAINQ